MVLTVLKQIVRDVAPAPAKATLARAYGAVKVQRARMALNRRGRHTPQYLDARVLETLMGEGFRPPDRVRYDADGLVQRATAKVAELAGAVPLSSVRDSLELGCWDAMVAGRLAQQGVRAYALDLAVEGVDARAHAAGARIVQSNAETIALRDRSIDLVYSFASVEHFSRPDRVLAEVARVLRPGGYAYLSFGPLYNSPYGRHAYRQIPVPFCHLLFAEQTLHAYAESKGLEHRWPYVNGWSLAQYRALLAASEPQFSMEACTEHSTGGVGLELVSRYPGCFRGAAADLEELMIAHIDVTLRRR